MAIKAALTFIVDCPYCKAKVAATEPGRAEFHVVDNESGQPYGNRIHVGNCPSCDFILVGESDQIGFGGYDGEYDRWSDIVRVYPKPPKTFSSSHIPKVVTDSLNEADRSLQAGANIAACVMLGRALEALCPDMLEPKPKEASSTPLLPPSTATTVAAPVATPTKQKKQIMLGEGIRKLREAKVIDDRLYDWSQQLHAFRNLAAHPEDISISRNDAEDLQTFVNAIVEYVYDLADRYAEFKARLGTRAKRKKV